MIKGTNVKYLTAIKIVNKNIHAEPSEAKFL